jgi:hypothetical protein
LLTVLLVVAVERRVHPHGHSPIGGVPPAAPRQTNKELVAQKVNRNYHEQRKMKPILSKMIAMLGM